MAQLRHTNITLYMGACANPPCLLMEYCARRSLDKLLAAGLRDAAAAASLTWPRLLSMALDAARGMLVGGPGWLGWLGPAGPGRSPMGGPACCGSSPGAAPVLTIQPAPPRTAVLAHPHARHLPSRPQIRKSSGHVCMAGQGAPSLTQLDCGGWGSSSSVYQGWEPAASRSPPTPTRPLLSRSPTSTCLAPWRRRRR